MDGLGQIGTGRDAYVWTCEQRFRLIFPELLVIAGVVVGVAKVHFEESRIDIRTVLFLQTVRL